MFQDGLKGTISSAGQSLDACHSLTRRATIQGLTLPEHGTRRRPIARRNMPNHNAGPIQLPSQQFQALFNSLFKVLCIFPSRYLFAIGLSPVFSFRWNLPPTLSCTPKQLDSSKAHRTHADSQARTGFSPSTMPCSKGLTPGPRLATASLDYNSEREAPSDLQHELFPLHSPLLGESLLVSFPPLSNMLKSSGSSFLI